MSIPGRPKRIGPLVLVVFALGSLSSCGGQARAINSVPAINSPAARVVHRRCPPSDRTFEPSSDPSTMRTLVPAGPTAVLVCRYWGDGDAKTPRTLAGRRYITADHAVNRLVDRLDALSPIPTRPVPSCPVFGGRSVLLLFRYRLVSDDPVRILREGCVPVSNGWLRDRYGEGLELGEHWPDEGLI
jgi:hypothetical protein